MEFLENSMQIIKLISTSGFLNKRRILFAVVIFGNEEFINSLVEFRSHGFVGPEALVVDLLKLGKEEGKLPSSTSWGVQWPFCRGCKLQSCL